MEKLSARKKLNIVKQFLSGMSYDEIASKEKVSKGSVANIVTEFKAGEFPEAAELGEQVELLRELSIELKRSKLSPGQCTAGLMVLDRIKECGLSPSDIGRLPLILKSANSESEAQEFVNLVHSIQAVLEERGLDINGLAKWVQELEKKANDLKPIVRKRDDCRKQLAGLEGQRDELARAVSSLNEKYNLLVPRVKDLEKREHDLLLRNKDLETAAEKAEEILAALKKEKQRLIKIGLSLDEFSELSQAAQSVARYHNVTPADIRKRLLRELEKLDETMSLEKVIGGLQMKKNEQERAIAARQQELENLKAAIVASKKERVQLDASLKCKREEISNMINGIIPSARKAFDQCRKELQSVQDEAVKAGKDIGRLEQLVELNQWIIDLLALVQASRIIEAKKVRDITMMIMRGFAAWLKMQDSSLVFISLSYTTNSLIKDLEQWKV